MVCLRCAKMPRGHRVQSMSNSRDSMTLGHTAVNISDLTKALRYVRGKLKVETSPLLFP